jgi:triosephosphate isomerase
MGMAGNRTPLIAGNWKMNGLRADGCALAQGVADGAGSVAVELLVCPPATLLAPVADTLDGSPVRLGGQDCHAAENGAHTGDLAAAMLADIGCSYVIVGHSERRQDHGESDAAVRAKAEAAHASGLTAIVCVGETEQERKAGRALDVVAGQIQGSLPATATAANTVVAYEPIWAIGTGLTPTPDEIQAVHAHARNCIAGVLGEGAAAAVRILYGGSVKPDNAPDFMQLSDVDGALIGGASLVAGDFLAIAQSCR